jgi:hypothetical protein
VETLADYVLELAGVTAEEEAESPPVSTS